MSIHCHACKKNYCRAFQEHSLLLNLNKVFCYRVDFLLFQEHQYCLLSATCVSQIFTIKLWKILHVVNSNRHKQLQADHFNSIIQSYLSSACRVSFCKSDLGDMIIVIVLGVTEITERKSGSFGGEVSATMQMLLVSS